MWTLSTTQLHYVWENFYHLLALFWNSLLLFFPHAAISFTKRLVHPIQTLMTPQTFAVIDLSRILPGPTNPSSYTKLVHNFNYHYSSLKLLQLFCTLLEMRGPQQHAVFNVCEQAIDLHCTITVPSVSVFIPFLEIPSTVWICFSYCFWKLSSILMELTILSPWSRSPVVTVRSEKIFPWGWAFPTCTLFHLFPLFSVRSAFTLIPCLLHCLH